MASSLHHYPIHFSSAIADFALTSHGKLGTTDHRRSGDTQRTLSASDAPHPPLSITGDIHGD